MTPDGTTWTVGSVRSADGTTIAYETAGEGPPIILSPARTGGSKPGLAERLTEMVSADRRGDAVALFLTDAVGVPAEAVAGMRGMPEWSWMEGLAHTLAYDSTVTGDGALPAARLAAIAVPTVVLDSTGSPDWLRDAAAATAGAIPRATHLSLAGSFHEVPPEVLAPALREALLG
ncbi:hypothetical protein U2F26_00260 [Micromonospora sp. 4G57]|uniref:Alpha/beta hydrolase n=1 Tax=Micromonospora sicca TaxID=2202420 RepID=A0ABU5JFK6_9ACTN|nr:MULTISPECIES: hypothetical protein [unclassified Micromonospora]MDZ5441166.1 hypothetical protein [Micromonospora sp. 4G57]MDZ5491392.1 hypothetical protein [Micromonospora sp. 4G53]